MKARDIMTTPVLTVTSQWPVQDAVRLMLDNHVSGLPVVDEGRLVGIITEADLLLKEAEPRPASPMVEWYGSSLWLERRVSAHRKVEGRTVGEVMTRNVITAGPETSVHELASRIARHQVNRLPILRQGEVVGIVTRADILKVFLRSDAELEGEARRIAVEFIMPLEEVRTSVRRGVLTLGGRVSSPARREALLRELEAMDGLVAIDHADLTHAVAQYAVGGE